MAFERFKSVGNILDTFGLSYETEYRFHPVRQWRFDYALPDLGVAIEYEGVKGKSRHTTLKGYTGDCEKYNEAAWLGWTVLRFTVLMEQDVIELAENLQTLQKQANARTGDMPGKS